MGKSCGTDESGLYYFYTKKEEGMFKVDIFTVK